MDLPSNDSNYDPARPRLRVVTPGFLSEILVRQLDDSAPASLAGFLPHSGLVASMPELVSDSKESMSLDETPRASVRPVSSFGGADGLRPGETRNDVDQVGLVVVVDVGP